MNKKNILIGTSHIDTNPTSTSLDFEQLFAEVMNKKKIARTEAYYHALDDDRERLRLKDGWYFLPGVFPNSSRAAGSVPTHSNLAVIDSDNHVVSERFIALINNKAIPEELSHLNVFYYHSASSIPTHAKIRIVFDIHEIEATCYESVVRHIVDILGIEDKDNIVDPRGYEATRLFYYPPNFTDQHAIGEILLSGDPTGDVSAWMTHPLSKAAPTNMLGTSTPDSTVSIEKVISAIKYLDHTEYDDWVKMILCIKTQYPDGDDDAMLALNAYSDTWEGKPGYDGHDVTIDTYHGAKPHSAGIHTLFYEAAKFGYLDPDKTALEEDFNIVPAPPVSNLEVETFGLPWVHANKKGTPKNSLSNWNILLKEYGVTVKYNAMSKDSTINIPDATYSLESAKTSAVSTLTSCAIINKLSTTNILEYLDNIADENRYNPAANWVTTKDWDGTDRIKPLVKTLNATNPELAYILLRRWLISGAAALFSFNGVSAQGVLVLQGEQNTFKTSWIERLVGKNTDFILTGVGLNPADKDDVIQVTSHWIVELGELDSIFNRAHIGSLKAFITKRVDVVRTPYARVSKKYPRSTVFTATVNHPHFLLDTTGNRRFWTIACDGELDSRHDIDMQQVWAQAKHLFDEGVPHELTRDEMVLLTESNEDHETVNPIEESIRTCFDFAPSAGVVPQIKRMQVVDILKDIGNDRPTLSHSKTCAAILRSKFGITMQKSHGKQLYPMPLLKDTVGFSGG